MKNKKLLNAAISVTLILILTFLSFRYFYNLYLDRNYQPMEDVMIISEPYRNSADKESNTTSPPQVDLEPVEARFDIYTNGTKRIFTDSKYHNQSENAFITASDPSVVYATNNATWQEFFNSLPMSLNKDCLITGTGQEFCTGASGTLRFYLNDIETPGALDYPIKAGEFLKVVFE